MILKENDTLGIFVKHEKNQGLNPWFLKWLNFKEECHYTLNHDYKYKSFEKIKEIDFFDLNGSKNLVIKLRNDIVTFMS